MSEALTQDQTIEQVIWNWTGAGVVASSEYQMAREYLLQLDPKDLNAILLESEPFDLWYTELCKECRWLDGKCRTLGCLTFSTKGGEKSGHNL